MPMIHHRFRNGIGAASFLLDGAAPSEGNAIEESRYSTNGPFVASAVTQTWNSMIGAYILNATGPKGAGQYGASWNTGLIRTGSLRLNDSEAFSEPQLVNANQVSASSSDGRTDTTSGAGDIAGFSSGTDIFAPDHRLDRASGLTNAQWSWFCVPRIRADATAGREPDIALEFETSPGSGIWLPYQTLHAFRPQPFAAGPNNVMSPNQTEQQNPGRTFTKENLMAYGYGRPDPRGVRFGLIERRNGTPDGGGTEPSPGGPLEIFKNQSWWPSTDSTQVNEDTYRATFYFPARANLGVPSQLFMPGTTPPTGTPRPQLRYWVDNRQSTGWRGGYYDLDGIQRPADGYIDPALPAALGNVNPLLPGSTDARSYFLDRPFTSVGNLGHVHRDLPWKTLDLCSKASGDAALMDYFTAVQEPETSGLRVNINTAPPEVISCLLTGVERDLANSSAMSASRITNAEANALATDISDALAASPLENRAHLAGQFLDDLIPTTSKITRIKRRREALIAALVEATDVGTWNVMIDLIVQTGKGRVGDLAGFQSSGETRSWQHLAIDRLTGKIVDQQTEVVQE